MLIQTAKRQLQKQLSKPWIPVHCRKMLIKAKKQSTSPDNSPTKSRTNLPPTMIMYGDVRDLRTHHMIHNVSLHSDMRSVVSGDVLVSSLQAMHALQLQEMQLLPFTSDKPSSGSSLLSPGSLDSFNPKNLLSEYCFLNL